MTLSVAVVGERRNWRKSPRVTDRCQLDRAWKHPRSIERNGTRGQWPRLFVGGRYVASVERFELSETAPDFPCNGLDGFTPGAGNVEISGTMFVSWKVGGE